MCGFSRVVKTGPSTGPYPLDHQIRKFAADVPGSTLVGVQSSLSDFADQAEVLTYQRDEWQSEAARLRAELARTRTDRDDARREAAESARGWERAIADRALLTRLKTLLRELTGTDLT